jgi:hypothetical protein
VEVEVAPGTTRKLTVRLPPDRWVEATVVEVGSRRALDGVAILLRDPQDSSGFTASRWETDEEGRARIGPLPLGPILVLPKLEGYVSEPPEGVEIAAGEHEARFEMARVADLAGVVLMPDGNPAVDAEVTVSRRRSLCGRWWPVETDERGRFRFESLPAVSMRLEARLEVERLSYWGWLDAVRPGEDVRIRLQPIELRDESTVRIVAPDGTPISDVHGVASSILEFFREKDRTFRGSTVTFRHHGSDFWVEAWGATDEDGTPLPLGGVVAGPFSPFRPEVEVRLPPERSVSGRVLDEWKRGMAGIRLEAFPDVPDYEREPAAHSTATTDAEGRFELRGLGDYPCRLRVTLPPDRVPIPERVVPPGTRDLIFFARR